MSVYIKGMDMPTSCYDCRFAVDGWCYAAEKQDNKDYLADTRRADFCPLVPADGRDLETGRFVKGHNRYDYLHNPDVAEWEEIDELNGEEWKDVAGYEGRYKVSNYGRIRNRECLLKQQAKKNGYLSVGLRNGENRKYYSVHRLVADAFVVNNNPAWFTQVNHKDENKRNNHADNLEWCDGMYNTHYGSGIKRMTEKRVELFADRRNNWRCASVMRVDDGKVYQSIVDAAEDCQIDKSSIAKVCRGERKTAGGFHWELVAAPTIIPASEEGE